MSLSKKPALILLTIDFYNIFNECNNLLPINCKKEERRSEVFDPLTNFLKGNNYYAVLDAGPLDDFQIWRDKFKYVVTSSILKEKLTVILEYLNIKDSDFTFQSF